MSTMLLFLLAYIVYILVWLIINTIFYFFSVALRKPAIFKILEGLTIGVVWLFNALAGIWILWIWISLLINKEFLMFFLFALFGAVIISFFLNLIQIPFYGIPAFFSAKIDEKNFDENVVEAEILDKDGKAIYKAEGDTTISVRMAKYFSLLYLLELLSVFIYPNGSEGFRWGDYIVMPFLWLFSTSVVAAIPYVIYHRIKNKSFLPKDKRYFFIGLFKIGFYATAVLVLIDWMFY